MATKKSSYQYLPDYAVHPGEILEETLEARKMKKNEFAERCGLSVKTVSLIINRKAPVEPETAIMFERVLKISADVWNNLDSEYRLYATRQKLEKKIQKTKAWAKRFPIKALVDKRYIERPLNEADAVKKLLDFFAVGSINAWETQFKKMGVLFRESPSFKSAPESVASWLRIGEVIAHSIETEPYNKEGFLSALQEIRSLTCEAPDVFDPRMKELCADAGVALVYVEELPGTHLSGATRWLDKDKALIMLSLRHKSDDHFWFSFFHEAAHVLRHGKKEFFLDEKEMKNTEEEAEANKFAQNILIPQKEYNAFIKRRTIYGEDIRKFARKLELSPGVIVGRLQRDGRIQYNWHNKLKRKLVLVESEQD